MIITFLPLTLLSLSLSLFIFQASPSNIQRNGRMHTFLRLFMSSLRCVFHESISTEHKTSERRSNGGQILRFMIDARVTPSQVSFQLHLVFMTSFYKVTGWNQLAQKHFQLHFAECVGPFVDLLFIGSSGCLFTTH